MKYLISILILIIGFNNYFLSQSNSSGYRIANKFHLEGDGFWDYIYIDDSSGRIYVSHGTLVQIINAEDGNLLGTIPDTKGVHGIAIAPEFNLGYTSNGRDTSVTIFKLSNFEVIQKLKVTGLNPDAILYDPFSKRIFTFNGGSSNVSVIDVIGNEVIATVSLDGKPEFAVTNGTGKIYLNIEDKNKISCINSIKLQVEQDWSISPGEEPSGLAIDNDNNILFSVCRNKLMVILDALDGHIIQTVPIGERVDGAAFDSKLKRAYSSNGEGSITVVQEIDRYNFKVLETVQTQIGARTCTISQKSHHLYLPTSEFNPTPDPTAENPHPRPTIKPGTFSILDVEVVK